MSLEVASQIAAIATFPIQAAPVCAATAVTAGLWVKSRHPDARIETWMQRIDSVMQSVQSNLDDIPYQDIQAFLTVVNGFFEQKSYLEKKSNENALIAWYRKKKQGDDLAVLGHELITYGLTISNTARRTAIVCRTTHTDADRVDGCCIKCFPEGRKKRETVTRVVCTLAELRNYSPPSPAPPKRSFFRRKKPTVNGLLPSSGSQFPASSGTASIGEEPDYPVAGPSNWCSPQAPTSNKTERPTSSQSEGSGNINQDFFPMALQPECFDQPPGYSITKIEVHEKNENIRSELVPPSPQADSTMGRPVSQVSVTIPPRSIYIFSDGQHEHNPWESTASFQRVMREICVSNEWPGESNH